MTTQVGDFVARTAERLGMKRESFIEKNMPTLTSNIAVIPFFGDLRSSFILSTFLLKPLKEIWRKYVILVSWPGQQGLFPYVDEYWTFKDDSAVGLAAMGASGFANDSKLVTDITRMLIEHFSNVYRYADLKQYYDNGFQKKYLDEIGSPKRFLPEVPSATLLDQRFKDQIVKKPGRKVLIYPTKKIRSWQRGDVAGLDSTQEFWNYLVERLLADGITPLVYQNHLTYDMSREFVDRCLYMVPRNIVDVLAVMRYLGCVLDVFSGVSRLAIAARTPFVAVDERMRFVKHKEYEIDDLSCDNLPRQYMFSFGGLILSGHNQNDWKTSLVDAIMAKTNGFLDRLDLSNLPSTNESYEVIPYDRVRNMVSKRMGIHFIKTSKER